MCIAAVRKDVLNLALEFCSIGKYQNKQIPVGKATKNRHIVHVCSFSFGSAGKGGWAGDRK